MASLYELLCHRSLTCSDPMLGELLSYLPTKFPSLTFNFIANEDSDRQSVHSIGPSVSAFYSDDSTYFSWIIFTWLLLLVMQLHYFYLNDAHKTVRRPLRTRRSSTASNRARRHYITKKGTPLPSKPGTVEATADGWRLSFYFNQPGMPSFVQAGPPLTGVPTQPPTEHPTSPEVSISYYGRCQAPLRAILGCF